MADFIQDHIEHLRSITSPQFTTAIKEKLKEYDSLKARKKDELSSIKHELTLLEHVLLGQCYFVRNYQREEILKELAAFPSWRRVDTVICWGWITEHFKLVQRGNKLYKPFQCEVGPASAKSRTRLNIDREFYVLRAFLPLFNDHENEEFNFDKKDDKPDFIVRNNSGAAFGIEITDANIDKKWAKNHGKGVDIMNEIYERFGPLHFSFSEGCNIAPNWVEHKDKVLEIFQDDVMPFFRSGASDQSKEWEIYGIYLVVHPSRCIDLRCDQENRPDSNDADERFYPEAMVYKIKEKLQGKPPSVRPCLLVIYPVLDYMFIDNELVAKKVQYATLGICFANHYDEIWYVHSKQAYKLLPA